MSSTADWALARVAPHTPNLPRRGGCAAALYSACCYDPRARAPNCSLSESERQCLVANLASWKQSNIRCLNASLEEERGISCEIILGLPSHAIDRRVPSGLVMAHGGQPWEIENPLYRYLIVSKLRSGIPTEQEGPRSLFPFFGSSLIYLFVCLVRRWGCHIFGCVVFYILEVDWPAYERSKSLIDL